MYIFLYQTVLTWDVWFDQLNIPEPSWPCAEQSCLRSFEPPSGCIVPISLGDKLNCRSQLRASGCPPEFSLCCACLLQSRPLSVRERCLHNRCGFFGRLPLNGSCYAIEYPLHSVVLSSTALRQKFSFLVLTQFITVYWCTKARQKWIFKYYKCGGYEVCKNSAIKHGI